MGPLLHGGRDARQSGYIADAAARRADVLGECPPGTADAVRDRRHRCAAQVDADNLGIDLGSPLLRERRTSRNESGVAFEYADDRYRPDIVAFSIDEKGRFFVSETFRVGEGVIDNRQHMDWLDEDLNSRSVETAPRSRSGTSARM